MCGSLSRIAAAAIESASRLLCSNRAVPIFCRPSALAEPRDEAAHSLPCRRAIRRRKRFLMRGRAVTLFEHPRPVNAEGATRQIRKRCRAVHGACGTPAAIGPTSWPEPNRDRSDRSRARRIVARSQSRQNTSQLGATSRCNVSLKWMALEAAQSSRSPSRFRTPPHKPLS